jgi:hypothetical protein
MSLGSFLLLLAFKFDGHFAKSGVKDLLNKCDNLQQSNRKDTLFMSHAEAGLPKLIEGLIARLTRHLIKYDCS